METRIFDYNWLNNIEDMYTNANTGEPEIILKDLNYPIRLGTSAYTGYIVTIKDLDLDEEISFNCDRIDLDESVIDKTYLAMRNKFTINNNGAYYARKNIKVISVTVPNEKYEELVKKFNINNSLLWRIWQKAINYDRSMI